MQILDAGATENAQPDSNASYELSPSSVKLSQAHLKCDLNMEYNEHAALHKNTFISGAVFGLLQDESRKYLGDRGNMNSDDISDAIHSVSVHVSAAIRHNEGHAFTLRATKQSFNVSMLPQMHSNLTLVCGLYCSKANGMTMHSCF